MTKLIQSRAPQGIPVRKNSGAVIVEGKIELFWTEKFIQTVVSTLRPSMANQRYLWHVRFTLESGRSPRRKQMSVMGQWRTFAAARSVPSLTIAKAPACSNVCRLHPQRWTNDCCKNYADLPDLWTSVDLNQGKRGGQTRSCVHRQEEVESSSPAVKLARGRPGQERRWR